MPARALIDAARDAAWSTPARRRATTIAGSTALLAGLVGVYLLVRPAPVPDYEFADLDSVLDFTFLTPEFNELPIEQRIELIAELVDRFRGMDQSDSVLMAAFAAGVRGAAREQLEANASRLMLDMVDQHATGYRDIPPDQRVEYIEQRVIELARTVNLISGQDVSASDEELLERARRDARRDQEYFRSERFSGDQAGRMFRFLNDGIGAHATTHQRARLAVFMRDMARTLRGEPLE